MKTSKDYFERALMVSPGGVQSPVRSGKSVGMTPIFFESGSGAFLKSVEGKEYIDFCQSFGPNILGHRDPDVTESIIKILNKIWTVGACEPYSLELAEWIQKRIPWVEKLRFVNSGTEAVMSALRLARAYTGRNKILKFEGCYHGHVDSMLVKAGSGLAGIGASDSGGVPEDIVKNTLVCPLGDLVTFKKIIEDFGSEIACVIIEPLPANFGLLIQENDFLKDIQSLTKENGSLFILDEVISGFRVGLQGMAGQLDLSPDLVTYGKIIGGGFPVGCYGGKNEIMDMVAPSGSVYQAGTLSGNPVGMVAGLTTLKKMEESDGWNSLNQRCETFYGKINSELKSKNLNWSLIGYSSLFWLTPASETSPKSLTQIPEVQGEKFKELFHKLISKGIYLAPSAFEVAFVSIAHSSGLLDDVANQLIKSIEEISET